MRRVPNTENQFGVFTAGQAHRLGWTKHALAHAVATGRLDRVRRGVYAVPHRSNGDPFADRRTAFERVAAAVSLANGRVPVSHLAAAALHGLWLLDEPTRVCVTFPRGRRDAIDGVHRHRGRLHLGEVVRYGPVSLLSVARTIFDIGCEHGTDAALVAADSALRRDLVSRDALEAAAAGRANWPGARAAARAITAADPRSESVLESISRLRLLEAGLPPPRLQMRILTLEGRFLGRVDALWDEFGVVGEADGLEKYRRGMTTPLQDSIRQGPMEDAGLIFARWGMEIRRDPGPAVARVLAAFARGMRADRAPRRWIALP